VDFQHPARFLGKGRPCARNGDEQRASRRDCAQISPHFPTFPVHCAVAFMKFGNDRNCTPSPLGPFLRSLVAQMILCKLSHIRIPRQGVLVRRRAGYEKQSLSDRLKDKVALVQTQAQGAQAGATAKRRRCSSPARAQRSSQLTSTSCYPLETKQIIECGSA